MLSTTKNGFPPLQSETLRLTKRYVRLKSTLARRSASVDKPASCPVGHVGVRKL